MGVGRVEEPGDANRRHAGCAHWRRARCRSYDCVGVIEVSGSPFDLLRRQGQSVACRPQIVRCPWHFAFGIGRARSVHVGAGVVRAAR
eukprot:4575412-Prymnesium_polylepis.2